MFKFVIFDAVRNHAHYYAEDYGTEYVFQSGSVYYSKAEAQAAANSYILCNKLSDMAFPIVYDRNEAVLTRQIRELSDSDLPF